jgi:hypothetical protein
MPNWNAINATIDTFFKVFDPGQGDYENLDTLMNKAFCADGGGLPWVGITRHGPQFRGAAQVRDFYKQRFATFSNLWWGESTTAPPHLTRVPRLYSNDGYDPPTVAVQTTFQGKHTGLWFQDRTRFSLPLSAIQPSGNKTEVPACAVFAFGAEDPSRISQLSYYMDRYNQMREVQEAHGNTFDTYIRSLLNDIHVRAKTSHLSELNVKTQAEISRLIGVFEKQQKKKS